MKMHAALEKTGTCLLLVSASILAVTLTAAALAAAPQATDPQALKKMTAGIHWLGHDSFRIEGNGVTVYIDPYRLKEGPKADLILITHDHRDHASPDDVARILKPETTIVTTAAAAEKLAGQIKTVKPGEELTVKGIAIRTLPAYNLTKFRSPGVPFHPRESGHVGYMITVDSVRIYHPGTPTSSRR